MLLACCGLDGVWPLFISPAHRVPLHSHQRSEAAQSCLPSPLSMLSTSMSGVLCPRGSRELLLPSPSVCWMLVGVCPPRACNEALILPRRLSEVALAQGHTASKCQSQNQTSEMCLTPKSASFAHLMSLWVPRGSWARGGLDVRGIGRLPPRPRAL